MENPNPQPGQTVSPVTKTATSEAESTTPSSSSAEVPLSQPVEMPESTLPTSPQSEPLISAAESQSQNTPQTDNGENFTASQFEANGTRDGVNESETITWTASEFIAHAKSFSWYAGLVAGTAVLAGIVFLISRDAISVGVVLVSALVFGVYAGHQPRQLEYQLDPSGMNIGQKRFEYSQFRSFSIIPEKAFASIVFMPLKRFAVPETIYFPPEYEENIVSLLSNHLPLEERGHDAVDRLMQRIRF